MTKTASAILADLKAALPIDGPDEAANALADALTDYAELTKAREPYATVSIERHRQAAAIVGDLLRRLTEDAEDEQ